jgi:DNA-binding transcriptional MerR regulator
LAAALGLNPKTIRYYESIGVLPEPARTPSGYRDYDEDYLGKLRFIRTAQRLGITLDEIREILAFRDRGEAPCTFVREVLDTQVASIDQRIGELRDLRGQLDDIAAVADTLPPTGGSTCRLIEHAQHQTAPA